jgi:hypothetical protein
MADAVTHKLPVSFRVFQYEAGDPFLALVFEGSGDPLGGEGKLFTLELNPGTSLEEAEALARLFSRKVTHIAMTSRAERG